MCDVILHLNCGCDFCCDYLNFCDTIFCVGICDYLCDFRLFRFFEQFFNSHMLQIVTLEQKLRKSFFGEIEFLTPSRSAGSALTPNTLFKEIYQRFRKLCSSF